MVLQWAARSMALAKREAVLSIALLLAVVSACFVPPSAAYFGYIDWNTLALLFSLMVVMKGYQRAGVFLCLANGLLRRVRSTRALLGVLVFLPFGLSMVVTNDVALLTFVPFGLLVLRMAGQGRQVVPLVVMQTLAANLGSMLTPMGNPQNLYLYGKSGMGFGGLCLLMLPYVAVAGGCLAVALLLSGFTNQWAPLIVGCNLGGLGTLIASMASLISYKEISRAYPDQRGRYFMVFTLCNVGMLALLLGLSALLGGG